VAQAGREVRAMLSYVPCDGHADALWLALPALEICPDQNAWLLALLTCARRATPRNRPLNLNLPFAMAEQVMLEAGFVAQQTLLWMECVH
jgi:hypothetical protein